MTRTEILAIAKEILGMLKNDYFLIISKKDEYTMFVNLKEKKK